MDSISSPRLGVLAGQSNRWLIIVHAATIFLSALLLFQVQPIISRFILPWFGGTPAVWTTAMLFFQMLLLAGYAYAHLSVQFFKPAWQIGVHLVLLAAAVMALPFVPSADWKPADGSHPIVRILMLLTVSVGLPYFVLSTTGPLVQAWFSRANPGRSPYRLYSLSNIGSLLALLTYPFLIEPNLALGTQAVVWQWAFWLFAGLCALGALCSFRSSASERTALEAPPPELPDGSAKDQRSRGGASRTVRSQTEPGTEKPSWQRRLVWLLLPALASTALLATTNHACQDVAVVPFLWIAPLSLYLLSFIICFDHERWYWPRGTAAITLVVYALGAILVLLLINNKAHWFDVRVDPLSIGTKKADVALSFGGLFCIAMLCHGEVVRLKPHPRYLTSFYLMIAAGGALGGLFVGALAPLLFSGYTEWYLAMICGLFLAISILLGTGEGGFMRRHARWLVPTMAIVAAGLLLAGDLLLVNPNVLAARRNFYGVLTVVEERKNDRPYIWTLVNGRITHGREFVDPKLRALPTTYYARDSGIGRAIDFFAGEAPGGVRVGAIGLGTGTLAAYARANDEFVFYEINPEVPKISREYFSYLADALDRMKGGHGHLDIIMGDARLSLEQQPSRRAEGRGYQVIAVDAFSGDAIPIHLITRQAGDVYLRQLDPDGVLAFHISNRYLDLAPVVRGLADYLKLQVIRIDSESDPDRDIYGASWMLLTNNEKLILALSPYAEKDTPDRSLLWTDDFSNLFQILK